MNTQANATPAGAADTSAPPAGAERDEQSTNPIFDTIDSAVAALDADQELASAPPPPEAEQPAPEPETPVEPPSEPEEELPAPQEAPAEEEIETPAYKAESEDDDAIPEEKIHGNSRIRLRDGTTAKVKELLQVREQLQEYQRAIPSIQQAAQRLAQEKAQLAQQAQQLQITLPLALKKAQDGIPPPPTAELWDTDPIEAGKQDFLHRQKVAEYQQLAGSYQAHLRQQSEQQQAAERQKAEQAEQERAQRLDQERQMLLKKMPHLNTPEKRKAYGDKFTAVARRYGGFDEQEVSRVEDHRLILMIMHLAEGREKWDALQAQKPKAEQKAQGAAPVQAPGPRASNAEQIAKRRDEGLARLSKTGSIDDAVALLNSLG